MTDLGKSNPMAVYTTQWFSNANGGELWFSKDETQKEEELLERFKKNCEKVILP